MTRDEILRRIGAVIAADTVDFGELVALSGLDPRTDFIAADLTGIDLRVADLSGYDLTGCYVSNGALLRGAAAGAIPVAVPFKDRVSDRQPMLALRVWLEARSTELQGNREMAEAMYRSAHSLDRLNPLFRISQRHFHSNDSPAIEELAIDVEGDLGAPQRVMVVLIAMAERDPVAGEPVVVMAPTHNEIAGVAGIDRVEVAQAIGEMARDGILRRRGGGIRILRLDEMISRVVTAPTAPAFPRHR